MTKRVRPEGIIPLMVMFMMCARVSLKSIPENWTWGVLFAHRGASGLAPENTLAAVKEAIKLGADGVEIDVHQTRDSMLVVIHDYSIDRTTGGSGKVIELTFEEIRSYSAGHWFDTRFASEKVPSLDEVLELVNGRTRLLIEIKGGGEIYPGIEERVVEAVKAHDARNWCTIQSFQDYTLKAVHRIDSTLTLHKLVMYDVPGLPVYVDSGIQLGWLRNYKFVDAINLNRNWISETAVKSLHKHGFKVHVWTVNDSLDTVQLFKIGVDGVITDFPNFRQKDNHSLK